jgi:16S rRNA (guanine527-N7)-methyltransferase
LLFTLNLKAEERHMLRTGALDFGVALSTTQLDHLALYLDELWEWNGRFNLTGLSSRKRIINDLLLDSLIPAAFLPQEGRLLDGGSGAGFPAIPLKVCKPEMDFLLMEANSRKVSFLKQVIRITRLHGIQVIKGRLEKDRSLLGPEGYHIITARALAPLERTLALCAPYLLPGGKIVSFQGAHFQKALRESGWVMKTHRLSLETSIPYRLPGKDFQRNILIFTKGS